jgi:pyruvate-formate lyase-activating enzyme
MNNHESVSHGHENPRAAVSVTRIDGEAVRLNKQVGQLPALSELALLAAETPLVSLPAAYRFGDHHDGVIEFAAMMRDGGVVEVGYYYGDQKPKSIIKVSSQVGCPFRCNFCNAGEEVYKRNLTAEEIYQQAALMMKVANHEEVPWSPHRHKINFAGTGEPLLNPALVDALELLGRHEVSIKVSTVFPAGRVAEDNFIRLAEFAGKYPESIQIQLSLISTDAEYRAQVAGGRVADFKSIVEAAKIWRDSAPQRPQINLSLILTESTPAEAATIWNWFPPELFRMRFRNYVPTEFGKMNNLEEISAERMLEIKQMFRIRGYSVHDDATPTSTEQAFSLASNVTRRNMMREFEIPIERKKS